MKKETPNDVAIIIALSAYAIVLVCVLPLVYLAVHEWKWVAITAGVITLSFVLVWQVIKYQIEYFIYKRIKVIYRAISRLKTPQYPGKISRLQGDIIDDVNKDVLEWARQSKDAISELEEQAAYRKEFIGNLAHELRTPAFNMQGYLLTLLEGGLDDPNINHRYLEKADKNLDRLIDLINDLDKITRIEAGEDPLDIKKFNIVSLAKDVAEEQEERAAKRKIKIDVQSKKSVLNVLGDEKKIGQVFTNLIVNAIRYGKDEGVIHIRFEDIEEAILVEVEDDGIGISEKNIARLFERFFRVDRSRARHSGGTGLGLAIVKHIIDAHNQSIHVRSEEGKGSVFSFTLAKG